MNDFTKEELQYLITCPSVGCYEGLIKKIQFMIDNYCKHDYMPPKGSSIAHVCGDCGREFKND